MATWRVAPGFVGKSGVLGKGLMSISVKADTKFPNASIALAQFFTNPKSMLEFAKIVAVYPSTPASYDDPFFSAAPVAIEDSAKPVAKDVISKYADIVPTIPHKADVNASCAGSRAASAIQRRARSESADRRGDEGQRAAPVRSGPPLSDISAPSSRRRAGSRGHRR